MPQKNTSKKLKKWICGEIVYATESALLLRCRHGAYFAGAQAAEEGRCDYWVPKYAIGNVRHHAVDLGVHLFFINRNFEGLENFKALDRETVQRLLRNDAVA